MIPESTRIELLALCCRLVGNNYQSEYLVDYLRKHRLSIDADFIERVRTILLQFQTLEYFLSNWTQVKSELEFDSLFLVLDEGNTVDAVLRLKNRRRDWKKIKKLVIKSLEEYKPLIPGESRRMNDEVVSIVEKFLGSRGTFADIPLRKVNRELLEFNDNIGQGSNGIVKQGLLRGVKVAIKQLHDENFDDILREATVLHQRNLPGVIRFYGVDDENIPTMIVMEWGVCSLSDWLYKPETRKKMGHLSFNMKLLALTQCASTLSFLHSVNLVHRDIKPSNIIIMPSRNVKLTDFGLAKLGSDVFEQPQPGRDSVRDVNGSRGTSLRGTEPYIAPELIINDSPYTYSTATDMYAFGVMMNEVLSGVRPYDQQTNIQAAMIKSEGHLRPHLFSVPSRYSEYQNFLSTIVERSWHSNPSIRFEANIVALQLEDYWKDLFYFPTVSNADKVVNVSKVLFASSFTSLGYYTGELVSNLRHGTGEFEFLSGNKYTGQWHNDVMHGKGRSIINGEVYDGEWMDGFRHGHGIHSVAGEVYEGQFEYGFRMGQGVCTFRDGSKYDGAWNIDMDGEGVLSYCDGSSYSGDWKEGLREGHGMWTGSTNRSYIGEWKRDKKDGVGVLRFENGDVYDGEWEQDEKSGTGVYKFANGGKYVGSWRKDKREGYGEQISPDGKVIRGEWIEDAGKVSCRSRVPIYNASSSNQTLQMHCEVTITVLIE